MESFVTMFRIILVSSFVSFVCGEAEGSGGKLLSGDYCNYNPEKNYDGTDLAECMNAIISDLLTEESRTFPKDKGLFPSTVSRQNPLLLSLNGAISSLFQGNQLPPVTGPAFQSNYPPGTFDLSPGIGANLAGALSSISRYDDYKCVPRILCEVASGKFPGRSLGKQAHSFLGRNSFLDWLARIDLGQQSPLLSFARAMLLGYGHKGDAGGCYRAYPRCPRDRSQLIYYLNNYNGGFFRLFMKTRHGVKSKSPYFGPGFNFLKPLLNYAPAYGFFNDPTLDVKYRSPILSNPGNRDIIYSAGSTEADKTITFPGSHEDRFFRFPKFSANSETDSYQYPSFFPQEANNEDSLDHLSTSVSKPSFAFP